jgi:hypothetical protein
MAKIPKLPPIPKLAAAPVGGPGAAGQPVNPADAQIPSPAWETQVDLPWNVDPETTWIDYRCEVEVQMDSGMALHKILPLQAFPDVDSLGAVAIDDPTMDLEDTDGTIIEGESMGTDIIQRMATTEYRFFLRGYGIRAGFQIPIPDLIQVGNAQVTPERQRAVQVIIGQFAGIPMWFAQWESSYIISVPPGVGTGQPVPFNPALKIRPDAQLPAAVVLPLPPDQIPEGGGAGQGQGP